MRAGFPDFRLGNVLATSFTATLTERHGNAVERIPTPQRLVDWLAVNGLAVDSCTTAQLDLARELRESIHAAAISIIAGERDGKLALCASPTCQAAFFDTSQSHTRRWCDMNTCGNRQKKARFNAKQRKHP